MSKIPIVLHIPHWSTYIPPDCHEDFLLDDVSLKAEVLHLTDLHTDIVAHGDWADAIVKAEVSRLVVDVERFRDDRDEEMAAVGMGAVYTRTDSGRILRQISPERKEELLKRYYDSHHQRLTQAVEAALQRSGRCLILDIHSFPAKPFAYEKNQNLDRPDICIGTDQYHTPPELANAIKEFYRSLGLSIRENEPFSGSIVPLKYYQADKAVLSVMIEFNRGLLMNDTDCALKESGRKLLLSVGTLSDKLMFGGAL